MSRKKRRKGNSAQKDKEEKKLSDILEKVKSSDDNIKPYAERFVRFYKLYRNYLPANEWPTKSRMFNPLTFSIIETQTAKMMSTKPIGEWKPAFSGAKGDPEKMQMAFDKWWREERVTLKAQDVFKKTLMYGASGTQIHWKFQKGFKLGQPYVKVNRPSLRVLRFEDLMFGFDPEADNFDDCKWSYIRYPISAKELKDIKSSPLAANYQHLDEAINSFGGGDPYEDEGYLKDRKEVTGAKNIEDTTIKKAECIYMENYETGEVSVVVGRKYIIMNAHNPHLIDKSLIFTMLTRIPSESIGMGDIEPIESLQHGANLFRNQRADNIDKILKPKYITSDPDIDDEDLVDEDILVVRGKKVNDTKPLTQENVTATAFKEDETIKNDVYAATSITPFSMGNDNDVQSDRSGVAITRLQSASDARVKNKLMNFELTFIKEVAEKWQRLMAQYQTEDIIIDDNGEEIVITPEDLGGGELAEGEEYGEWNFNMETGSTQHVNDMESREDYLAWQKSIIELAELKKGDMIPSAPQEAMPQEGMPEQPMMDPMAQMNPMMPQPPMPPKIINWDKMAEKLSEKYGQKDWREVWIIEEEPEQMKPVEEDMLPGVEAEQGEMLPSVDGEMQMPQEQQEMLPQVGDVEMPQEEMLPSVAQAQQQEEMLPGIEQQQPQQEMLPSVDQNPGLLQKIKAFFSRNKGKKKGNKEQLPRL